MKKNTVNQLSGEAYINSSKDKVWKTVSDFGNIAAFHPLVKSSHRTNTRLGKGARRYCELLPMGAMEEEVVDWVEGRAISAKVVGGKMLPPCRNMTGKLELTEQESGTLATFTFSYQMKYGALGRLMNLLFIKPQFKQAPIKYVQGLKSYTEAN